MKTFILVANVIALIVWSGGGADRGASAERFEDTLGKADVVLKGSEKNQSCPIVCKGGGINTVVVVTATERSTKMNVPVLPGAIVAVYYRCSEYPYQSNYTHLHISTFQLLCEEIQRCGNFSDSFEAQWQSTKTGTYPTMYVDLRLPPGTPEVAIKTIHCGKEKVSFSSETNQTMSRNKDLFTFKNLSTIKLSVIKFEQERIAEVVFNVTESKCLIGWHRTLASDPGYECHITIDKKEVEGGYASWSCPREGTKGALNMTEGKSLCQDLFYGRLGCSYLCAIHNDAGLTEGGYIMRRGRKPPGLIGSRGWTEETLPLDLARFNECQSDLDLCQLGRRYCQDKETGFLCSAGEYNLTECISGKALSRYWRCPVDAAAISLLSRTPGLFQDAGGAKTYMDDVLLTFKRQISLMDQLRTLFDVIRIMNTKNKNPFFMLSLDSRRYLASSLLNTLVDNLFTPEHIHVNQSFENDLFYSHTANVHGLLGDISILMAPGSNKTEFVKINLKVDRSQPKRVLSWKFIQFKGVDMMKENDRARTFSEMAERLTPIASSEETSTAQNRFLFKNSLMFSLQINDETAFEKVQFKLGTFLPVGGHSWLFQVENLCGFLDKHENWTWATRGCQTREGQQGPYCECDHLSNFAILFSVREVRRVHLKALGVLSVIGGMINIVSLTLFITFVLFINSKEKLRIDQLNISICLLLGTIVYLSGSLASMNSSLCTIVAMSSQFFFLCAFTWKLILGINVVRLIVTLRCQNEDWLVKYRWTLIVAAYGTPGVLVSIFGGLYTADYRQISDKICWIDTKSGAFLSFLVPVGVIVAVNMTCLAFIANTLLRNYINTRKTRMKDSNEILVFVQLLVSMGLTWLPSYLALKYVTAMYVLVLAFPCQGLLMFLLVVVINKENREKVSTFIVNSLFSITSKSSTVSEPRTTSKSKISGHFRGEGTEESCDIKFETVKAQEVVGTEGLLVMVVDLEDIDGT